jgi:hypothetical protein
VTESVDLGGLYDGLGQPLFGSPPFCDPLAPGGSRPGYALITPGRDFWDGTLGCIWLAPPGMRPKIPDGVLAELVAALDSGKRVALHGESQEHMHKLAERVRLLSGGGHG